MTQPSGPVSPPSATSGLAFEGGTAFLLARAGAAARRSWARMLTERGLTPHHHGVLMALAELGPTGQQQLSEVIGIDPRNVVPVVDVLVERVLLVREIDAVDRRRRVLALTTAGQQLVRDLTVTGGALERDFLRALDPAQQQQLHRMLIALLSDRPDPELGSSTTQSGHAAPPVAHDR